MSDLHANTDIMRSGAAVISKTASEMSTIASRVSNLANHIGGQYNGQLRAKVHPILAGLSGEGSGLQGQSAGVGSNLSSIASEIDNVMQSNVASVSEAFAPSPVSPLSAFFNNVGQMAMGGVAAILGWVGLSHTIPATTIPPQSSSSVQVSGSTSFGQLLATEKQQQLDAEQEWWNSNSLNQLDPSIENALKPYGNIYNGCGETSLAMLINYYRSAVQGETADQMITPSELAKLAGQNGDFGKGTILSFKGLEQLANAKGFTTHPPVNSDGTSPLKIEDLQTQVQSGNPVIVYVSYVKDQKTGNYVPNLNPQKPTDYDHFVIATNISNGQVTLVNPLPSYNTNKNADVKPVTVSLGDFQKMWSGQGIGIQPK